MEYSIKNGMIFEIRNRIRIPIRILKSDSTKNTYQKPKYAFKTNFGLYMPLQGPYSSRRLGLT